MQPLHARPACLNAGPTNSSVRIVKPAEYAFAMGVRPPMRAMIADRARGAHRSWSQSSRSRASRAYETATQIVCAYAIDATTSAGTSAHAQSPNTPKYGTTGTGTPVGIAPAIGTSALAWERPAAPLPLQKEQQADP
jgi:hypothetical protein